MERLELEKMNIKFLADLKDKGRLELQPHYQRSDVWDDSRKYNLIDTVMREWPMGLVLLRVIIKQDEDGIPIEFYDVVDGQQRLTTLFDYIKGMKEWTLKPTGKFKVGYVRYAQLSQAKQYKIDEYKIPIALMRDFEESEVLDIYQRLQTGKPLNIGEKLKALRTEYKEYIRELASHKLFKIHRNHTWRDTNWNFAVQYFKAIYVDDPLTRIEFEELKTFLHDASKFNSQKAEKSCDRASSIMTYMSKVFSEAKSTDPAFENNLSSARTLKWVFASLMEIINAYGLVGKEHLVGKGLIEYYKAIQTENSKEWVAYMNWAYWENGHSLCQSLSRPAIDIHP